MRFAHWRRRRAARKLLTQRAQRPFSWMLDGRFWRRHPMPFAKTEEGRARREARRHRETQRSVVIDADYGDRDDGWFPMGGY